MKKIISCIICALLFLPICLNGQDQILSGFQEHDGFFLRFHAGYGMAKMVEEGVMGSEMTLTGPAGVFRFQIGGTVSENLVLFGEIGAFAVTDPTMELGGESTTLSGSDLTIQDFGAGLTYYIMPANFYFSLSGTMSSDEIKTEGSTGRTETGYGVYFSAGKEWWVSADWALGVAGFAYYSSMDDKWDSATYPVSNTVFGVVFSATYQ